MSRNPRVFSCLLAASILTGNVWAGSVFLLPNSSSTTPVISVVQPDANVITQSFPAPIGATAVLGHPTLNKYYVLSKSSTDTVIVIDGSNFTSVTKRLSLGQGQAFAISPDGRRLVVAADSTYIIDAQTDTVLATISDTGSSPNDVAISLDGTRAFVLSATSNKLTAIDLNTNAIAGASLSIPGTSTSVTIGPNGLVYVTTVNRLFEIDPKTNLVRTEIPLNARPGKLSFTSDGKFAVAVNQTPITGSSVLLFDLIAHTLSSTIPNFNTNLTSIFSASDSKVYAYSADTQQLYEISLTPFNITVATFGSVGQINGISAVAVTNEVPTPKYLFLTTSSSLYRIDLTTNPPNGTGQVALSTTTPGGLAFATQAATGTPTRLLAYNNSQTIVAAGTFLPLIVRAIDSNGRPLVNVPVTFSTDNSGATIQGASVQTNGFGYAQTSVLPPATPTTFKVTASAAGGAVTSDFNLTFSSGTGGGGGGTGAGLLSIFDGNGQFVPESFLLPNPLVVKVVDASGTALAGQTVTFTVIQGSGTLQSTTSSGDVITTAVCTGNVCTSITDANGLAKVGMLASLVVPGFSYSQTVISAATGVSTVQFIITTVTTNTIPTVQRITPQDGVELVGQAGTILKGAVQVRVFSSGGVQAGQPIPSIGLKAYTSLNDPLLGPTASCVGGTVLSDTSGVATCDLLLGGKLGLDRLIVSVGSAQFLGGAGINIRVLAGPPARIAIRQGNNQSGNPGAILPLAFVAEINDAFGNLLAGQSATFEVVDAGSITLQNVVSVSDSSGRVSALGKLGAAPGAHQVRVKVGNVTQLFTFTVNVNVTQLNAISGDGQTAIVNTPFTQPLTVKVLDDRGAAVTGAAVNWSIISGAGTLSAASSNTDANGIASISVTAGSTSGALSVRASFANLSATFNLTIRLQGPVFTANQIVNAASGAPGVVPCSLVNIFGTNLAPKVQGTVFANFIVGGPLPTILQGIEVLFDGTNAPIYAVSNVNGQEQLAVQAPCSLSPGTTTVTVRNGGLTAVSGVPVLTLQPGIFETLDATTGRRYAVLLRSDGSYVTPSNPARRGDILRLFATGLGAVNPATDTNRAGVAGQSTVAGLIVGVNDGGVRVVSSAYAPGMIGVYVVDFEVPADTATGNFRSLAVASDAGGGNLVYGQGSSIAAIQ